MTDPVAFNHLGQYEAMLPLGSGPLINHMLQAQQMFTGAARGEPAAP